ncbi:MAG: S41 family peptidase, partial [Bacteroidota bacterium]
MIKIRNFCIVFFLSLAGTLLLTASNNDYYLNINKSFEIFGGVFRELTNNYVDEVDPADMMKDGIDGILKHLDPYTNYIQDDDSEDIEIITNGSYNGLGITVGIKDSMLTIIDMHDGFSAQRNGVRIGDRIYSIDTVRLLNSSTDELRKYTRGKPGSKVNMTVLRGDNFDTLHFILPREEIKLNNVSYSGMLNDTTGYIRLERFSRYSAEEVRRAVNELKRNQNFRNLILDLRDNPGGLLESAVAIIEIFVKPGSTIVSTRGRNKSEDRFYKSLTQPLDTNLKLAVLINKQSASASEIVAGAIQDLDRGVIIGERSFGKGLVQTIFDLPYNNLIKITTSKYYTPSGRCIQRLDFHNKLKSNIDKTDSVFHTKNGRLVIESSGIMPDTLVKDKIYSDFARELIKNDLFFEFAGFYTSSMDSLPIDFKVNNEVLKLFKEYSVKNKFLYNDPLKIKLDELTKLTKEDKFSKKVQKEIESLKNLV